MDPKHINTLLLIVLVVIMLYKLCSSSSTEEHFNDVDAQNLQKINMGNVNVDNLAATNSVSLGGDINLTNGNGWSIQKVFNGSADRYGFGQYPGGQLKMFTATAYQPASASISFATADAKKPWVDAIVARQPVKGTYQVDVNVPFHTADNTVLDKTLTVAGDATLNGNTNLKNTNVTGNVNMTGTNDWAVGRAYGDAGNNYGVSQNGVITRVYASGTSAPAAASLSITNIDPKIKYDDIVKVSKDPKTGSFRTDIKGDLYVSGHIYTGTGTTLKTLA